MEPLAARIRPNSLKEFVGQKHLLGPYGPLATAIKEKHLFSFILWGPPGVGKTSLARLYAKAFNADFFELSAVASGKEDIRAVIEKTGALLGPKILFLDEIHRFNKAQQDFLLPYVESGQITLIGATTENPSFEVIPALLSRCRVFVLEGHSDADIKVIIKRAASALGQGYTIDTPALKRLIDLADGDARQAIALVEHVAGIYKEITVDRIEQSLQKAFIRYDKTGEQHHDTISAFIKSMRASQPDAAIYYLARMIQGGEDPKFIARRMVIFASEDIGLAQPTALVFANEVFRAVETIGLPEAGINLAHGAAYLAKAPKNRNAYSAYKQALADVERTGNLPIPKVIRNAPTRLMKEQGYGVGYELYTKEDLFPDKLKGTDYGIK